MNVFTPIRLKSPNTGKTKTVQATHLVPRQRFSVGKEEVEIRFMSERNGKSFWDVTWNPDQESRT